MPASEPHGPRPARARAKVKNGRPPEPLSPLAVRPLNDATPTRVGVQKRALAGLQSAQAPALAHGARSDDIDKLLPASSWRGRRGRALSFSSLPLEQVQTRCID